MNDDCIEVKDVACCPKYLDIWVTKVFMEKQFQNFPWSFKY